MQTFKARLNQEIIMYRIATEQSVDIRSNDTSDSIISNIGSFAVVATSDLIMDIVLKNMVYKPLLSVFHKVKNMLGERREQRVEDIVYQAQEYLRNSNKKVACFVAFDILSFYMLMKARRGFISTVIEPTMFYVNDKCFSNFIPENIIKNLCDQHGNFDYMYLCTLLSVLSRVSERVDEVRIHRNLAQIQELEEDQEVQQPDIDVIEEAQEFRQEAQPEVEVNEPVIQRHLNRHNMPMTAGMFRQIF